MAREVYVVGETPVNALYSPDVILKNW